jgi:hypothetical protein
VLTALALLPLIGSAPTLDVPPEVVPTKGYAILTPGGTCKAVTYVGLSGEDPMPGVLFADKRVFVFPTRGLSAGRYRFAAIGSLEDVHVVTEFTVVVGTPPTPPTPPGPGPTPPPPLPPGPVDPLTAEVLAALNADPGTLEVKRQHALAYAGLMAAMVAHVEGGASLDDVLNDFRMAAKGIMPAGSIPGVQKVCTSKIIALVGDDLDRPLDAALKKDLKALFARLALALTEGSK